jgi:hypothetical protein
LKRFRQDSSYFDTLFKYALKRGVHLRVVTEEPQNENLPKWINYALIKQPSSFQIKTAPNAPLAIMVLFDNAEMCVAVDEAANLRWGAHLWSNSDSLIALGRAYFECIRAQSESYDKKAF